MRFITGLFFALLLSAGCQQALESDRAGERGPGTAKADSFGSCETSCGGQSQDGTCWCDEQCAEYGDCCDDVAGECGFDECDPVDDSGCAPGEVCTLSIDHGPATCEEPGDDVCGGLTGEICGAGEYCDYQPGDFCGAADVPGTCEPIPEFCIEIFAPVCGCDGLTYGNSCKAAAAGTGVLHEGACEEPQESCESLGGTCMNSPVDPSFPADCEEDFDMQTIDGECPAINESCCFSGIGPF